MTQKIIFFDIDGTLVDEENFEIPKSTLKAIKQAQNNGHLCFINTGRAICTIDKIITDIGFDGYVCGCGTYIEFEGKSIFHNTIEPKLMNHVIQKSEEYNIQTALEGKNKIYFSENISHPLLVFTQNRYKEVDFPICSFNKDSEVPFDKFVSFYDETIDIEGFKNEINKHFDIIQRDDDFIEVVPYPCSKASGIQFLVDYLGLSIEDTISIGDSTNDLTMLEYTYHSVAMGNSNPLILDKVNYITTDINDDGIKNALEHFNII